MEIGAPLHVTKFLGYLGSALAYLLGTRYSTLLCVRIPSLRCQPDEELPCFPPTENSRTPSEQSTSTTRPRYPISRSTTLPAFSSRRLKHAAVDPHLPSAKSHPQPFPTSKSVTISAEAVGPGARISIIIRCASVEARHCSF